MGSNDEVVVTAGREVGYMWLTMLCNDAPPICNYDDDDKEDDGEEY